MERYLYFKDLKSIDDYVTKRIRREIGEGSEGTAYLTKDNMVLKMLDGYAEVDILESQKESIIMQQDYNVSTYLFPKQLLIAYERVQGYLMDFFPNNIIAFADPYNGDINDINIDNLLRAREEMIKDTIILSDNNIVVHDLTFNLLFDNNKLGAIDTLSYYKKSNVTLDENIGCIDYALLHELHFHDKNFMPDYNESLEYNLKRIKK